MRYLLTPLLIFSLFSCPAPAGDQPGPAQRGPRAEEFYRIQGEINSLLAEMANLQLEYRTAPKQQREQILLKWKQLLAKGEQLEPKWIDAAKRAFAEAPNADQDITMFVVRLLAADVRRDDYESAYELGRLLMQSGCGEPTVANASGIAAFVTNHLEDAEKYLGLAAEKDFYKAVSDDDKLAQLGRAYFLSLSTYKNYWKREEALRLRQAESDNLPRVLLKTTKGDILLELFENEAPNTVANFISLVEAGFYDGLTFHRVMSGFMAQGGCPRGDGSGDPGYTIACECYKPNHRLHFRGSLSMAHRGRDTGGSQFFLTFVPTFQLNGKHTVFGRVIEGMNVLAKLQRRNPDDKEAPLPDKIIKAEVVRKRPHPYKPEKMPQ